mgnify:CR=1 FL=1
MIKDFSKYNVLVVDDVPLNQTLVSKMLSRFNFRIRTAGNGLEAMEAVSAEKPSLILLDIMMPVLDGFEVLKLLKARKETADIRVIILSALNSNQDVVKGYELGANDFITKPVIMEKLVKSVAVQLELTQA